MKKEITSKTKYLASLFILFILFFGFYRDVLADYQNLISDSSVQTGSSYNHFVQTLGTGLSGSLSQVDIQTSNPAFIYYGSTPYLVIFECDDSSYGGLLQNERSCSVLYEGLAQSSSLYSTSTQSFLTGGISLDPTKYYYFLSQGNNQFNTLTYYYGSLSDTVEGSCYKYISGGNFYGYIDCPDVADLYFDLVGVDKVETPEGNSSVLFLPGFMASRLYDSSEQLWEPGNNADVERLYLDENGESINDIHTKEIIKETNVPVNLGVAGQNIYKSFSSMMDDLVFDGTIKEWQSYAYDWRQDIMDIVDNGTKYENESKKLEDVLESLAQNSNSGKVTIIAHSNGGLLAKALLNKLQDDKNAGRNNLIDKVDVLILVAVPQIGTGKAVPSMLHGYDQHIALGFLMNESVAREFGKNIPGAYGLLPSREYINRINLSPVTFDTGDVTSIFTSTYGNVIDSYGEYKNFLFGGEGRENPSIENTDYPIKLSQSLFSKSEDLHNQIDYWVPPQSMRVIEVAGWGLDTVAGFNYYPKNVGCHSTSMNPCSANYILDERPIFTIDGDETVVASSAQYIEGNNVEQYWVDLKKYNESRIGFFDKKHKNILEVGVLNNLFKSVLEEEEIITDSVVKNTIPVYTGNRLRISIHSPVKIGAYDSGGNFTGKICQEGVDFCYVEEGIVNSSYMEFGEGKYINLPEEELNKVTLEGTDVGTFTFEVEKVLLDQTSSTSYFRDIPVTPEMKGEFTFDSSNQPELKLDITGDGTYDFFISSQNEFDPILYLEIMKQTISSLNLKESKKSNFIKRIDKVIKLINKGKIDKAELKAEKFTEILEKRLDKKDSKRPKPGKLTKDQAEDLLIMLENLLNNLEK